MFDEFSPVEQQVYDLMVDLHTNEEIAETLGISYNEARKIVHRIYAKMGIMHKKNRSRLYFLRRARSEKRS